MRTRTYPKTYYRVYPATDRGYTATDKGDGNSVEGIQVILMTVTACIIAVVALSMLGIDLTSGFRPPMVQTAYAATTYKDYQVPTEPDWWNDWWAQCAKLQAEKVGMISRECLVLPKDNTLYRYQSTGGKVGVWLSWKRTSEAVGFPPPDIWIGITVGSDVIAPSNQSRATVPAASTMTFQGIASHAQVTWLEGKERGPLAHTYRYVWLVDGKQVSTSKDATLTLAKGTRQVTLRVTDENGGKAEMVISLPIPLKWL